MYHRNAPSCQLRQANKHPARKHHLHLEERTVQVTPVVSWIFFRASLNKTPHTSTEVKIAETAGRAAKGSRREPRHASLRLGMQSRRSPPCRFDCFDMKAWPNSKTTSLRGPLTRTPGASDSATPQGLANLKRLRVDSTPATVAARLRAGQALAPVEFHF